LTFLFQTEVHYHFVHIFNDFVTQSRSGVVGNFLRNIFEAVFLRIEAKVSLVQRKRQARLGAGLAQCLRAWDVKQCPYSKLMEK
jgi:hypothetical protein